jgi:hypothetical protein
MNVTHIEHYGMSQGDTIPGPVVTNFIETIWAHLRANTGLYYMQKDGPFYGYRVETWHKSRVAQGGVDKHAGLTGPMHTRVNGNYLVDSNYEGMTPGVHGGVYSHEFGHNYHFACKMEWDGKTSFIAKHDLAKVFIAIFRRLRAGDFTPDTNEVERFTEDFKYFFGTNGIAGKKNFGDDANKPKYKVRWAKDIIGLKEFIQGMWPVFHWLRDSQFRNLTYNETKKFFQWERHVGDNKYNFEGFVNGFYQWDGAKWAPFRPAVRVILEGKWDKWKPTGVIVTKGQQVRITASGKIAFFHGGSWQFPPAGEATKIAGNGAPAPGLIANSLVVKAGGAPIYVGAGATITAQATTELLIAANDDFFWDNDGFWEVLITV